MIRVAIVGLGAVTRIASTVIRSQHHSSIQSSAFDEPSFQAKTRARAAPPNPDTWQGMDANANSWLTMGKFLDCGSRQGLTHSFPFNTLDGP